MKCKSAEGTLGDLFWRCPMINQFWSNILHAFLRYTRAIFLQTHAKRNILSLWKSDAAPRFKAWLSEVTSLLQIERIQHNVSLSSVTFDKMWQPFSLYLSRTLCPCKFLIYSWFSLCNKVRINSKISFFFFFFFFVSYYFIYL